MFDLVPPHQHISSTAAVFDKAHTTTNIYLRQSNAAPTHAVIQLVEVSPPPRRIASVIRDDSLASSSYESGSSYYSSSYDSEGMDLDEEEEDEEADGESYCSSDDEVQQQQQQEPEPAPAMTSEDQEAFARRMKRILVWRELTVSASSDISSTSTPASSTSQLLLPLAPTALKRSASSVADECDAPSSKRSRCGAPSSVASDACPPSVSFSTSTSSSPSSASSAPISASIASSLRRSISPAELSLPSCTACDAFFPTVDAFRAHAHPSREACGAAVEYAFEH